ncbi:Plug domain-containing protein [Pinibacter soli]|uniref:Plug domain-containing protein n=1 Tax=Pinibacter soli TaxID=3044211 RepID=A0ABT6RAQ4_9BACT|nr:Plug domain-containing protein [Pinibacter soli]MDI3319603.1 Plug domain-containing protein [Pinibacter soli]
MKYLNLMLCGMLACTVANAQTDSTYLDLGRMRARKDFTQTTVIKASDLAQMPFTNLSDAIRLWVNGVYTDKSTMAYIVDGVMINDADAYSIYDIEEITVVKNALSQPNGAGNSQMLALIATKRNKSAKPQFFAAAQAFAVTQKPNVYESKFTTALFHQYIVNGSATLGSVAVGGSLNYLHDAAPHYDNSQTEFNTTENLDRLRLHVWAETNLGKKSRLVIQGNYTPQNSNRNFSVGYIQEREAHDRKLNESLLNTTLQLQTAFNRALQNKFSAGYTTNIQKGADTATTKNVQPYYNRFVKLDAGLKGHVLFLNDNLSYSLKVNDWLIEPALDFNFQSVKYESHNNQLIRSVYGMSAYIDTAKEKGNCFTITPSVTISYKKIFSIQGGFMQDLSKLVQHDYNDSRAYPFVTIAASALPSSSRLSLKIYGSYAETFAPSSFSKFQVNDLYSYNHYFERPEQLVTGTYTSVIYLPPTTKNYGDRWHAGTDFSFFHKRITLRYNYMNASDLAYTRGSILTSGGTQVIYSHYKNTMQRHQVSLTGQVLSSGAFQWHSGLFLNFIKNIQHYEVNGSRYYENHKTGGWTNRFNYKRLSLGADLLYLLNEDVSANSGSGKTNKHSSILLQNVYLGYRLNFKKIHDMNVYVSSCNLADSNIMPLASDRRRFYGGGVKFDF